MVTTTRLDFLLFNKTMTLTPNAKLNLNESQAAIVGALVTEDCYLQFDAGLNAYQLHHNRVTLGYALSLAEVEQLIEQGLVTAAGISRFL